jgi:hypothetical protein
LIYSQSGPNSSKAEFMSNFSLVGLKRISMPVFESYFRNHQFNQNWNLKNYALYGMCKTNNLTDVEVNIPNYSTVRILD